MKIELHTIKIRDLINGFEDKGEEGVFGYNGNLDIRPAYQRDLVYDTDDQRAVIQSIFKGFPLNVMYWTDDNGHYEMLDGQQRTLSICNFYKGCELDVMIDGVDKFYGNLTETQKEQFLDYELMVYFCYGTDTERLDWFKIINTYGKKLSDQELRNAIYNGPWTTAAKKLCSKHGCYCQNMLGAYMKETTERQQLLQTILKWICDRDRVETIEQYMAIHQNNENAQEIKDYITQIAEWIESVFPEYDKKMKGLPWGLLYNIFHKRSYDAKQNVKRIHELEKNGDITRREGIYEYILDGEEKHLQLRTFSDTVKEHILKKQNNKCAWCGKAITMENSHADHIIPWSKGGETLESNCEVLCIKCNIKKGAQTID